jgi:hypothetical protein
MYVRIGKMFSWSCLAVACIRCLAEGIVGSNQKKEKRRVKQDLAPPSFEKAAAERRLKSGVVHEDHV